jgi:hypothetical protein
MKKAPTLIADYNGLSPWGHKKFDYKATSLPGDDLPPVKAASDMFPAGVGQKADTFASKSAPRASATDCKTQPALVEPKSHKKSSSARSSKPKTSHCIVS